MQKAQWELTLWTVRVHELSPLEVLVENVFLLGVHNRPVLLRQSGTRDWGHCSAVPEQMSPESTEHKETKRD